MAENDKAKEVEGAEKPKEKWGDLAEEVEGLQKLEIKTVEGGLETLDSDVVVDQNNPESPLYSVKDFGELGLNEDLLKGIFKMGFKKPSKIQETALPIILGPQLKHLIAQSQSGTGKTGAFVLSMLSKVDPSVEAPQALCVTPTRELADQVYTEVIKMSEYTKIKTLLLVGGTGQAPSQTPKGPISQQVVIGTPGKLLEVFQRTKTDKIKIFVLDEADVMIDTQGLGDQTTRLRKLMPSGCQQLLFSATYSDKVQQFARKIVPEPRVELMLKREELSVKKIDQYFVECGNDEKKYSVLSDIYGFLSVGQSIIFVNTKRAAEELEKRMTKEGHLVGVIHGEMDARSAIIDKFKSGETRVLISTNLLARGIDVSSVSLVVNYDLPVKFGQNEADYETYLHRIGRSGRFGREGIAINLVRPGPDKKTLDQIEKYFGKPINQLTEDKLPDLAEMLKKLKIKVTNPLKQ
eukprot:TRINITY_DN118_c0_g1_i3.p1 TRINITY_DN118_c0_g1~~TRINITY_DN118_c0_g1_i3.p1  ORF type:complete len:485 (-),score=162.97 TRINITY_DN118_c0_g1_i3:38-1429(-)